VVFIFACFGFVRSKTSSNLELVGVIFTITSGYFAQFLKYVMGCCDCVCYITIFAVLFHQKNLVQQCLF